MNLRKTIMLFIAGLAVIGGCKKENTKSNITDPDNGCVQSTTSRNGEIIAGKYIISFKTTSVAGRDMSTQRLEQIAGDLLTRNNIAATAKEKSFGGEPAGFIATLSDDEADRLRNDETVAIVEHDRIISLANCFTVAAPHLLTWNINRVGYGNGIGKTAWIIDTGIDFGHPDLTVDVTRSKSFVTNITSADDENGHGTHVGGIIGAKNNTFGILGVASGATLVSLRVMDKDGKGTLSSIVQALAYVNTNAAAGDVVNMSIGDEDGISATLDQQVQYTAARGIYIAIAAGNDHDLANKYSPGRANGTNIYTVSAIDSLDNFASFSNYGNDVVDYATPGVRILSTFFGGRYAYMSGTSMAAPHMAGLLLLRGRNISTSGFAKNDPDGVADPVAHY